MQPTPFVACALLALSADSSLRTAYQAETALRIETTLELSMKTTAMSMVRDGEPIEGRGFGGGGTSSTTRSVVVDRYVEAAAGAPGRVRRHWKELEGESVMSFGGEDRSLGLESDFEDLVVEITRDEDGEVGAEVVEGDGPAVEVLNRMRPSLALDAFLPGEEIEEDAEWALENDAVRRGLGLDVSVFRAPEREGGGGRGGRGGFGRDAGPEAMLAGVQWSGRATFAGLEVLEEVECARIELKLEGEYERDEDDSTSTLEVELEGTLWFDLAAKRPLRLEVEGSVTSESDSTRERDGSVMEMHRESEGTFSQRVLVAPAPFEEEQ